MNLLQNRINRIKESLRQLNTNLAASLLISTVSSDDMFSYWSACCQGSEKVPKILKYIKFITFDPDVPTAMINFMKGDLRIGINFFMEYIKGPEDLLFILIHERNHLILRKLYPDVLTPDYPGYLFNFGEDAYINGISRRYVPSTLPERFYKGQLELLLTGHHNRIDWDYFKVGKRGDNPMKDAHGIMYKHNNALLKVLGEHYVTGHYYSGYKKWMELVYKWHKQAQERKKRKKLLKRDDQSGADKAAEPEETKTVNGGDKPDNNKKEPDADTDAETAQADKPEAKDQDSGEQQGNKEGSEEKEVKDDGDAGGDENEHREEAEQDGGVENEDQERADTDIDDGLKNIVPLVQAEDLPVSSGSQEASSANGDNLIRIPLPDLKPGDPIVKLILSTCELYEFRKQVQVFEADVFKHVDTLINGILSDRATERSYEGYSVSIPCSITRRDVFALSAGQIPVMWQRRVGVERPLIDLYMDVSGSMNKYYGYIPYIYDALKHVMGRIFQFSTKVVEVDHQERYLSTTGGTSFNCVAQHMIKEQVKAAILFSDGMATLSGDFDKPLKQQLQHFVYIKVIENTYKSWEHVATEVIILHKKEENHV